MGPQCDPGHGEARGPWQFMHTPRDEGEMAPTAHSQVSRLEDERVTAGRATARRVTSEV